MQTQSNTDTQGGIGGSADATLQRSDEGTCANLQIYGIMAHKKALHNWIKYHWKPNGELKLHLGSKAFFTVVFINLEDRDRVFEGGPYFHASVGLYMQPWKENFLPRKRDLQKGISLVKTLIPTLRLLDTFHF
jgi:hypothetical protein